MADKIISIPLAQLVEDWNIYPRHALDDVHVNKLLRAIEANTRLPEPIIDNKSKRIIDGWHRCRAWRRYLGDMGIIDVITRDYADEIAILLDAISLNTSHGRPLDKIDYVRCVTLCRERQVDSHQIAAILHRTVREVNRLATDIVRVPPSSTNVIIPGTTQLVPAKRPIKHLSGQLLTAEQAAHLPSVPGTSYLMIARQLIDAVKYELANREDVSLQATLVELRDALIAYCQ